jgi:pimeloyl-ACP methyl ester carboxylesterase
VIKFIRWCLFAISGSIFLILIIALLYRAVQQSNVSSEVKIEPGHGIQSLEQVELGGLDQWIKIRGQDRQNPILLFLHGGPGMPELPVSHLFDTTLEQHFTVVHWDQRASGKTRRAGFDDRDLTISTFKQDTLDLVNYLRSRFDKDKIYLIGHSWGTMLGLLVVRDNPELFHAYIGMGQLVNLEENETVSLEFVRRQAEKEGNEEALQQLANLNPPYANNIEQLSIQRQWLYRYGGGYRGFAIEDLLNSYVTSPDYSLLDLASMVAGVATVAEQMWPEMVGFDSRLDVPELQVPAYFFTGRYDYNTPSELTQEYFDVLKAPHKEMVWFEDSAHFMNVSDSTRYQSVLIDKVLKNGYQ